MGAEQDSAAFAGFCLGLAVGFTLGILGSAAVAVCVGVLHPPADVQVEYRGAE
jgi:hypothetical protein